MSIIAPDPMPDLPGVSDPPLKLPNHAGAAAGRGISRATFIRGTLATGIAVAAGARLLAPPAAVADDAALSPLDLIFSAVAHVRPLDLLPRPFAQVREGFDTATVDRHIGTGMQAEGRVAGISHVRGGLRIHSSAAAPTLFRTDAGPVAPYASVIVTMGVNVQNRGREAAIVAGLVSDVRDYVIASFEAGDRPDKGTVGIDVVVNGKRTRVASGAADLTAPARFAFVVNENYVSALVGNGTRWIPITQARITELLDLRDPSVLRRYNYGIGVGGIDTIIDIAGFEAGYFGQVGIRDLHVVSYSDGTPYIRDNRLYFTATQAGLAFFPAAHWGVWTLDLENPSRIEPVASLFFARDGLILGDHAGQIVADERDGGFHIAVSAWGDFDFKGVHVRYMRTFEDVLRGVHVLESARMPLPTDIGTWDPAMVRIDDRWYVGFIESPYQDRTRGFNFHPALACSDVGGGMDRLSRVGADLTRGQTEGMILQKIGGRWYVLASDGDERKYRVYDLSMRLLGFLNAPYGTNIPHPQIVPIPDRGQTYYLLLTFDGTPFHQEVLGYGTHGDFIVMRASQTMRGYEFMPM